MQKTMLNDQARGPARCRTAKERRLGELECLMAKKRYNIPIGSSQNQKNQRYWLPYWFGSKKQNHVSDSQLNIVAPGCRLTRNPEALYFLIWFPTQFYLQLRFLELNLFATARCAIQNTSQWASQGNGS